MFFEAGPPGQRPDVEYPSWAFPPETEIGAVLPVDLVVARSDNAAIVLPTVRAYTTGCLLEVEVACRQGALSAEDWWDLSAAGLRPFPFTFQGDRLPDRLMRYGVRYADGTKATTLDRPSHRGPDAEPPAGPLLSWRPRGGGSPGRVQVHSHGLWLWPLPPPEIFEFAVEWPVAGIGLTIVQLDGAAIGAAAGRSQRYWPDGPSSP